MSAVPLCKAMIMAAGLGTRLYPLTGLTAKPMVPILNRPVMEHMLRLVHRHGVREVAANLHHHPDLIRTYFGDGSSFGVDLRYNLERELLGTAGGVGAFRGFFADGTFVVVSGDGLTDVDIAAFVTAHRANGGIATMAVKEVADPSLYGVVVADADGRVTGFQEKPPCGEALSNWCSCGIYALEPQIFEYITEERFTDWARDVFPALLADGVPFFRWELKGYWSDVGDIEQYRLSNFDALLGRVLLDRPGCETAPGVWVGDGTVIEAGACLEPPILVGAGSLIEAGARLIGPLVLGDGCVIERGAQLDGGIHWDGVKVGRDSRAVGSIIGRGVVVHARAVVQENVVIGDGSSVAAGAVVSGGARLAPNSAVTAAGVGVGSAAS
jgi:NDP-sugar pyrophosphorylase family protein